MQLAPDVHVEWVEDEAVVLNAGTGELHYLNPTAALIFALIAEHGVDGAAAEVKARYAEDPSAAEADFTGLVEEMVKKGLLVK